MKSMNVSSYFEGPLSGPLLAIEYPVLHVVDRVQLTPDLRYDAPFRAMGKGKQG
jgi:hypothetical protein